MIKLELSVKNTRPEPPIGRAGARGELAREIGFFPMLEKRVAGVVRVVRVVRVRKRSESLCVCVSREVCVCLVYLYQLKEN